MALYNKTSLRASPHGFAFFYKPHYSNGYELVVLFLTLLFLESPAAQIVMFEVSPSSAPSAAGGSGETGLLRQVVAGLFITIFMIFGLGLLLLLPYFIGIYGAKASHWLLRQTGVRVTLTHLLAVQAILIIVPLLIGLVVLQTAELTFINPLQSTPLQTAMIVLGAVALLCFSVQKLLVNLLHVDPARVW